MLLFDSFSLYDGIPTIVFILPFIVVFIGLVMPAIVAIIGMYNLLIARRNEVEESYASMDIYLKKRYDLIPNLVQVVKGYAKHEQETLTKVIEARQKAMDETRAKQAVKEENVLSQSLTKLFALRESYPELKADKQFLSLQQSLLKVEDEIADARKDYNESVRKYNTAIESFPTNIFAKMFHHTKREMYEVEHVTEKENIKIDL